VNNNDDDDETLLAQRTSPVSDGGLSTPHTNFGGGGLGSDTQPGRPFGRSGRGSPPYLKTHLARITEELKLGSYDTRKSEEVKAMIRDLYEMFPE
jgi:hypothetical protein